MPVPRSHRRRERRSTEGTRAFSPTRTATSGKSPTTPASHSTAMVRSPFLTSARSGEHARVVDRDHDVLTEARVDVADSSVPHSINSHDHENLSQPTQASRWTPHVPGTVLDRRL